MKRKNKMSDTKPAEGTPITYTAIILDQSGSMADTRDEAVAQYNEQVQQMKLAAKDGKGKFYGSLVTFNGNVFEHLWCEDANLMKEVKNPEDYVTDGATAMRDALGYTVEKLLATTDSKNPNVSYLVVVISDGQSHSDKYYRTREERLSFKEITDSLQRTGRWTFSYLGCSEEDAHKIADEMGIAHSNTAAWSNKSKGLAVRGMGAQKKALDRYYSNRGKGMAASANLYSDDGGVANFECAAADNLVFMDEAQVAPTVMNVDLDQYIQNAQANFVNCSTAATEGAVPFANRNPVEWGKKQDGVRMRGPVNIVNRSPLSNKK